LDNILFLWRKRLIVPSGIPAVDRAMAAIGSTSVGVSKKNAKAAETHENGDSPDDCQYPTVNRL
jgi:hypothetical protein